MTKFVAGIDFGTTNSAAAISDGTAPRMVDVEAGKDTIPNAELSSVNKMASVGLGLAYDAMRRFATAHI